MLNKKINYYEKVYDNRTMLFHSICPFMSTFRS